MSPHPAAAVILLREPPSPSAGLEVCMVRRRRGSSFMASAYVFPGGGLDAGESEAHGAARELFEEAGVALVRWRDRARSDAPTPELLRELRRRVLGNQGPAHELLAAEGLEWDDDALVPWAHWITPSVEPKRFSAKFFLAALPLGQLASADEVEAVELSWVRIADAAARAAELALPPPQLRTLWELQAVQSVEQARAAARARAIAPILPRGTMLPTTSPPTLCLLLPWDPQYHELGNGEALALEPPPDWATGPSRFVLELHGEQRAWRHLHAPGSTTAGS